MKLVEALLDHRQFEVVRKALRMRGISGFTISFVVALVASAAPPDDERRGPRFTEIGRIKIEVVAHDDLVGRVVAALSGEVGSKRGPDEIYVLPLEQALRIRTDEIDEAAIS